MPNLFTRATVLSNVCGRINYITSPEKKEKFLASYDGAGELMGGRFWPTLARECQTAYEQSNKKSRIVRDKKGNERVVELKCRQGRELMIQLSNSLLDRMTAEEIVKTVADEFKKELNLNVFVGAHLKSDSSKEDNLHVHVILPERDLLSEPVQKIAERNLFYDADGKRRYKKSEILDENKNLLPGCRIVKKGEVYETRYFSTSEAKYGKKWLKEIKTNVVLKLRNGKLKGDVKITEYDPSTGELPQQHIGKRVEHGNPELAEKIKDYNEDVKQFNYFVREGILAKASALLLQGKERRVRRNKGEALKGFMRSFLNWYHNDYVKQIPAPEEPDLDNMIDDAEARKVVSGTPEPEKENQR